MATYNIDPMHSAVKFKVKHLMISTVTGEFKKFNATMAADQPDFSDAKISFDADVDSIDTNMEQRDLHLKGEDFFNAAQFPKLSFVSSRMEKTGDNTYKLTGDLTIRDVTLPVGLNVEYGGSMVDFYGQTKLGFDLSGKISRKEFGLTWSAVTEAGGIVVGDDIKLEISIQMTLAA